MSGIHKITVRVITCVLSIILVITGVSTESAFAAVNEGVTVPKIDSKAGYLYCTITGDVLYSKSADKKIDPYSITKLMTCLIAVENTELSQEVTVTKKATELGGSTMFLQEGEVVTVEQLLYGALVLSGNDAAYMLSIAASGNTKDFVALMNAKAESLGCEKTHFANPHGLKAPKHYTTARDYCKIVQAVFENETVRKIAGTKKYHMAATNKSEAWDMKTHVDLLDEKDSGVIAGKTGYWEDYDCSIALMYNKDGLEQILVLLGSNINTRKKDARKLLKYGTERIVSVDAVSDGEVLTSVLVKHGEKTRINLYTDETVKAYPVDGKKSGVKRSFKIREDLEAPLEEGEEVGSCVLSVDGKVIGAVPVKCSEDVAIGWYPSYLYISNNQTILLGSVFGLLVFILILRRIRISRQKKAAQEYEGKH